MLFVGDPAPTFVARTTLSPKPHLQLDQLAGRYIVLSFLGSAGHPVIKSAVDSLAAHRTRFEKIDTLLLGVSVDPEDERLGRLVRQRGIEFVWDFDRAVSCLYGAARPDSPAYQPGTVILDRGMRVAVVIPFDEQRAGQHFADVVQELDRLPPLLNSGSFPPILQVPRVFEPEFCRRLIAEFERYGGGRDVGVLRERGGQTVRIVNDPFKTRRDHEITDPALLAQIHERLRRRLAPAIKQAFQFDATHVERNTIGCYDAAEGGHFWPHRDDTTPGSSHRRFAVTINLNAEEYAGGDLRFREFGLHSYRSPTGAATVFSCSLLHEVLPVERGRRYAYLPFMHDEAAARLYEANREAVAVATAAAV
jgi:peroxiredoxin/predicted 2-oxoglutarate/Fe(II)-dependent dioxygenase YbiX